MDTIIPNNPYVGPRSIKTGEAFFGRDREVRSLSALLISERIVMLHSPSGAGKSSLIQAGLIPIMRERFNILPVVRVNLEPPEEAREVQGFNRYVLSTLISLEEGLPAAKRLPFAQLAALTLDGYLEQRQRQDQALENDLLIFDQFEEVLTTSSTDQIVKQEFFEQVGEALQNRHRWALFAIREDFMGGLALFVRAIPNRLSVTFRLGLLGPDAAKLAIQQPARDRKVDFTDSAAETLVSDLRRIQVQLPDGSFVTEEGAHVEPVQLQVVCYNLWQSHAADDNIIDEGDLKRVGNVDQALSSYYANAVQSVVTNAKIDERIIRQWVNQYLITPGGIRGQVLKGAESTEQLPNIALRLLENTHIIRSETRAGKTWYELSHDRLVKPVRASNAEWFEQNLSLFQRQSVLWTQRGHAEGLLLRGKEWQEAEKEAKTLKLTIEELAFLEACRKVKAREDRDRWLTIFLTFLAIGTTIAMIVAGVFYVRAQDSADIAQQAAAQNAQLANENAEVAATAKAAEEEALNQKSTAVVAEATAQAAKDDALNQKATAQAAEATAQAANDALQKTASLRAEGLVSRSIAVKKINNPLSLLLGIEAFNTVDNGTTRSNLLQGIQSNIEFDRFSSGHENAISSLAFSPDGSMIAAGSWDSAISLWNPKTGQRIGKRLTKHTDYVFSVAFSPNEWMLASGSKDKTIILWNAMSGEPIGQPFTGHTGSVLSVDFSPDGYLLASGGADNVVIIWDINGNQLSWLNKHTGPVHCVAFSPDGQILASGSADDSVILWEVSTGKSIRQLHGSGNTIRSLAFSPDGKILATGSWEGVINLWDVATGQLLSTLSGHKGSVEAVDFSPDAKILASSGADDTTILWDTASGGMIGKPLTGHKGTVWSVAFSPDGKLLASAGADKTIILWKVDTDSWIAESCKRAGRNFSSAEWQTYFPGEEYRLTCPQLPAGN